MTALRWLPALVCGVLGVAVLARRLATLVRVRRDSGVPVVGAPSHVRVLG